MKKKLFIIAIIAALGVSLYGCKKSAPVADKDGGAIKYTLDEVYDNELFGFYVKNTDNTFTPINQSAQGYESSNEQAPSKFFWWSNVSNNKKKINYDKITPKVTSKKPLVAIFKNQGDMPEAYTIERYKNLGYTIGTKTFLGEDENSMFISTQEVCADSQITTIFQSGNLDERIEIAKINGSSKLPYSNVDTDVNALIGLQKNKFYKLTLYVGTQTKTVTVKADTQIFKSQELIALKNPLKKTGKQYFIVNLPDNMKHGYYYLNDIGVFKY